MSLILVLDDDAGFAQLVKTIFTLEGYQAETVPTPEALMPRVRQAKPMLVLLDVHFLKRDTFDLMRALRAEDGLQHLPVVMTSGMDRRQECLDAGANAFLMKPFHPDELLAMIANLVPREGTTITHGQTQEQPNR